MNCYGPGVDGPVCPSVNDWRRDPSGVVLAWGVTRVAGGQGHAARPESQIMGQEPGQDKPTRTRPSQAKHS